MTKPTELAIVADRAGPVMTAWLDPIFRVIDHHRSAYAAMEKAGDEYDASPEDSEGGPIEAKFHEATDCERGEFDVLLAIGPTTIEGLCAIVAYVHEVGRRQSARGHFDDRSPALVEKLKEVVEIRGGSIYAAA